jgi:hypothetical protein
MEENIVFASWAGVIGATLFVCAIVSLARARGLLRRCDAINARVEQLGPAEFGAQNLSPTLERNGLREHIVRLGEGSGGERVRIRSYWWREAGTPVRVIYDRERQKYSFAGDVYFLPGAYAIGAVSAFVAAVFLLLGPFPP